MYNTQLLKILKTLTKQEMRELGKYVAAPYFNLRLDVIELFNYLAKSHGSPPSVFEKEKVFFTLFPNKKYDDALMRILTHQLLKIVKTYFVQKEIEANRTDFQLLLSKAFRKRGIDEFFEKEIEHTKIANLEQPFRHADFHLKNYQIKYEEIEHITLTRRKGDIPLTALMQSLYTFFATEMLRLNSVNLSYQNVTQQLLESPMLNEVLNWLEKIDFIGLNLQSMSREVQEDEQKADVTAVEETDGSVLKMYYHVFLSLKTGNADNFNALKQLLNEHWKELPETERRTIYLLAFNFCTKKINNAEWAYLAHFFDLMESGLKNRSLFENGIISKFTYKNAVTAALRLGKYDWARAFLDTYKPFLHRKEREAVYAYNLATYYFRKKDYDNAQILFQRADFGDIPTNLAAKAMLIRIYFENDASDALESLLDSCHVYIHRQKEIGYSKDYYLNFIKIVRKMRHINPSETVQWHALGEEVSAMKNVVEKEWLLEKLKG